ncbi:MAG: FAD-binding protein, partial [Clostridiales bacterium]|nr:FAD-binding protein [Clostridiales bacterium]
MIQNYTGKWDYEFDVVIVGFGGAGGCAAVEAHDADAKVVLLEKQPKNRHYSNTRMSGGGFHCPDQGGDREALKEYAKAMFSGENIPWLFEGAQEEYSDGLAELWAEYAPKNAEFMGNLDPKHISVANKSFSSAEGGAAYPDFPGAKKAGYNVYVSNYIPEGQERSFIGSPRDPKERKQGGEAFFACILNGINERGIPVHYETRAQQLLHNEGGAIIGVRAEKDGHQTYYRAKKAVLLTSGGFEYNMALRSAFLEGHGKEGWAFYGSSDNTGDGIIMGIESGAALAKVGSAASRLIASFPDLRANGVRIGVSIVSIGREHAILVDNSGSRFCNERDISEDPAK